MDNIVVCKISGGNKKKYGLRSGKLFFSHGLVDAWQTISTSIDNVESPVPLRQIGDGVVVLVVELGAVVAIILPAFEHFCAERVSGFVVYDGDRVGEGSVFDK